MGKEEIDSILLANQYLICKISERDSDKVEIARRYLNSKISRAIRARSEVKYLTPLAF